MSEQVLYFVQQMFNGVTLGSTYALIAIGYTMVYGIIGMINFAHGEVYMIGSYVSFMIIAALMMMGIDTSWLLVAAGFIGAIVIASAYGWSIERVAYRPVRNSKRLIALISAIGMSIFLQNYVSLTEGSRDIALPSLFNGQWIVGSSDNFSASITTMQLVIWIVTFIAMLALTLFIRYSRMGRACRACAEDLKMASLLGINTDRVIALTFVIGAAMAAVAGVLLGQFYGVINPYIGFMAGMKAFTAAVLGGIGSIPGAMIGGLILGIAEALSSAYLSTEYKDVVSFALLIVVLLVMPTGILGRPEVEKVWNRCNLRWRCCRRRCSSSWRASLWAYSCSSTALSWWSAARRISAGSGSLLAPRWSFSSNCCALCSRKGWRASPGRNLYCRRLMVQRSNKSCSWLRCWWLPWRGRLWSRAVPSISRPWPWFILFWAWVWTSLWGCPACWCWATAASMPSAPTLSRCWTTITASVSGPVCRSQGWSLPLPVSCWASRYCVCAVTTWQLWP